LGFENIGDEKSLEFISENILPGSIDYEGELINLTPCKACNGMRLRKEALSVRLQGLSIGGFARMPVKEAMGFIDRLQLSEREMIISKRIRKEVKDRLLFLHRVGLDY
jgi:excinuclease ABC subunit A